MQVLIQVPAARGGGGRGDHLPCKIRGRCLTGSWESSVNISVEHDHFSPAMPTDTSTTCIPPSRLIPSSNRPTTSTFVREAGAIPKEGISLESWMLLTQEDMSPHDHRPCGSLQLQSLQPSKVQLHDPTVPQGARTTCFPLVSRAGSRAPQGWVTSRRGYWFASSLSCVPGQRDHLESHLPLKYFTILTATQSDPCRHPCQPLCPQVTGRCCPEKICLEMCLCHRGLFISHRAAVKTAQMVTCEPNILWGYNLFMSQSVILRAGHLWLCGNVRRFGGPGATFVKSGKHFFPTDPCLSEPHSRLVESVLPATWWTGHPTQSNFPSEQQRLFQWLWDPTAGLMEQSHTDPPAKPRGSTRPYLTHTTPSSIIFS